MKVFSIVILALCGAYSFALSDDLLDKTLGETPHDEPAHKVVNTPEPSASLKSDDTASENISALREEIAALREELGRKDEHRAEEISVKDPVADYVPRSERISATGHLLRPIRLQVEGGGGDGSFFGASLSVPWGWFDIAIKSHVSSLDCETKHERLRNGYYHYHNDSVNFLWHGDSYGLVEFQLNPWRESFLAPYLGVGGGWHNPNLSTEYRDRVFGVDKRTDEIDPGGESFINGGIKFNGRTVFFDFGALVPMDFNCHHCYITEIGGDLGFYLTTRTQLHILAKHKRLKYKSYELDYEDGKHVFLSASMFGVGLSYDF